MVQVASFFIEIPSLTPLKKLPHSAAEFSERPWSIPNFILKDTANLSFLSEIQTIDNAIKFRPHHGQIVYTKNQGPYFAIHNI